MAGLTAMPALKDDQAPADQVEADRADQRQPAKTPSSTVRVAQAEADETEETEETETETQRKRPWTSYIWDSWDKSPEDRRLVAKIDWFVLSYACIAYFVKYLDQTNVANAYVSGMKEDLRMHGNDFNLLGTAWTVGYILGQLPSQLVMTRVPPSVWLPSLELAWSLIVIGMAAARSTTTLFVLRFFVGLLEASAYPGIMTLLGNWYCVDEQCKRACIFQASASVAQMCGGYLQAALYRHMDGVHGLAAWRWLFVFDGIVGVPVALYGFVAIPNSPATTRARWLTPSERIRACERMRDRKSVARLSWRSFKLSTKNLFREWPVYLFTASFVCYIQATRVYAYFGLWLKDTGRYSVVQINTIPTAGFGLLVVFTLVFAWTSDGLQTRWPLIVCGASMSLVGAIILAATLGRGADASDALVMSGFMLTFLTTGTAGVYMTYMTEVLAYNYLHRAVVIALADTAAFVFVAWLPLVTFNTAEAPYFRVGYTLTAVFLALQIIFILLVPIAHKRWPVGQYEEPVHTEHTVPVHRHIDIDDTP